MTKYSERFCKMIIALGKEIHIKDIDDIGYQDVADKLLERRDRMLATGYLSDSEYMMLCRYIDTLETLVRFKKDYKEILKYENTHQTK